MPVSRRFTCARMSSIVASWPRSRPPSPCTERGARPTRELRAERLDALRSRPRRGARPTPGEQRPRGDRAAKRRRSGAAAAIPSIRCRMRGRAGSEYALAWRAIRRRSALAWRCPGSGASGTSRERVIAGGVPARVQRAIGQHGLLDRVALAHARVRSCWGRGRNPLARAGDRARRAVRARVVVPAVAGVAGELVPPEVRRRWASRPLPLGRAAHHVAVELVAVRGRRSVSRRVAAAAAWSSPAARRRPASGTAKSIVPRRQLS